MNETEEKTKIACPNKACRKVFAKPLKTLKLHEGLKENYNACQYCLTEIVNSESGNKNLSEETVLEVPISKEETSQNEEKNSLASITPAT